MKNTFMEYGLYLIATILLVTFFAGFAALVEDGGAIRDTVLDFINDIC